MVKKGRVTCACDGVFQELCLKTDIYLERPARIVEKF